MLLPKIVYGEEDTELLFTYPPVQKPGADDLEADRRDTTTASGIRQSVWARNDIFKTLQMDYVPAEDLAAWSAFMAYALEGHQFQYHPDADASPQDYELWTLEDTKWAPKYNFRGVAKFTIRLRKVLYS
jgi:hypothetical protein